MEQTEQREHWAALAICAMQPLVVTWLFMIALAVGVYAATASSPVLADSTWLDAIHVGSSLWLLACGATISSASVRLSLLPLLLTAVLAALLYRFAKRGGIVSWADVGVYAAASGVTAGLAGLFDLPGTFLLGGVLGAGLLGGGAALLAWRSWYVPAWPLWQRIEEAWRLAVPVLLGLALAGVVLFVVGLVVGHGRVDALYSAYVAGSAGRVGLSLAQLCWLPTLAIWAVSIAAGAPVHVGSGTAFSAFTASTAPLPGIPFLGALPAPGVKLFFLPLVLVGVGALAALWLTRTRSSGDQGDEGDHGAEGDDVGLDDGGTEIPFEYPASWRDLFTGAGLALALVFVVLAVAGALASGSLGSGRLVSVGVNAPLFALLATLESGLGFVGVLALRMKARLAGGAGSDSEPVALGRGASVRPPEFQRSGGEAGGSALERGKRHLPFGRKQAMTLADGLESEEIDEGAGAPVLAEVSREELAPSAPTPEAAAPEAEQASAGEQARESTQAPSDLPRAWLHIVPVEGDESL